MNVERRIGGVDIGDYNSEICIFHQGEPVAISLMQGSFSIPTLIVNRDNSFHYGYEAYMISGKNKDDVVFELIYYLRIWMNLTGERIDSHSIIPSWTPLKMNRNVYFLLDHNQLFSLSRLFSKYISYLLDCGANYFSYGKIKTLGVSIPIHYNYGIRILIQTLLQKQGVSYSFYREPEVAVLAHIYRQKCVKKYVLFCSYGATSFDTALVSTYQNIKIVKKDGQNLMSSELIGGKFCTTLIRRHLKSLYKDYTLKEDSAIQSIAEKIKLAFYDNDEYFFDVMDITNSNQSCSTCLEENTVRDILSEYVEYTINDLKSTLDNHSPSETEIIVCGQEARSPLFKEAVKANFGKYQLTWYDGNEAFAAYGACLAQAYYVNGFSRLLAYSIEPMPRE